MPNRMPAVYPPPTSAPEATTTIYYSTSNLLRWLVSLACIEWLAGYGLLTVRPLPAGGVFALFIALGGALALGRQLWLLLTHPVQLTLSAQGIQHRQAAVAPWSSIQHEQVKLVKFSRGSEWFLWYRVGTAPQQVSIRKLAIQPAHLTQLLQHYRAQAEASST